MSVRAGIEASAQAIETLAVVVIVVVIAVATAHYLLGYLSRLEILVAADVVRTVTLDNTLRSIAGLGLLVLIRTFLSWSLMLEIEGRWPWQRRGDGARPSTAKDHEQRARMAL